MANIKVGQLLLAAAFLAAPAAALDFENVPSVSEIVKQARKGEAPAPPSAPAKQQAPEKEWTIMVFMNGKNSLSEYVIQDMNEMERFGAPENVNLVTQAARMEYTPPSPSYPGGGYYDDYPGNQPGWPNPYYPYNLPWVQDGGFRAGDSSTDWIGVRRYLVSKDGEASSLGSTMLQDIGTVDMGDWRQLTKFGKWAKQNYPAKRYMLIVWNHGSGWEMRKGGPAIIKGISYDDETGNGINTVDLASAVREMGGVDIYASDACLMQMAEVAYELKDAAAITVGSEENEPGPGWGYHEFLSRVHDARQNLTPEAMAGAAVRGYAASYGPKGTATTQSAIHASALDGLRALLDQWATLAMEGDKTVPAEARKATISFGGADSRDLLHFIALTGERTPSVRLKAKGEEIIRYFADKVLIENATTGAKFEKAGGLAIYLPGWGYSSSYDRLAWSADSKWDEFTRWLNDK